MHNRRVMKNEQVSQGPKGVGLTEWIIENVSVIVELNPLATILSAVVEFARRLVLLNVLRSFQDVFPGADE